MSETLPQVRAPIGLGKVEVSLHAARALVDDGLLIEPAVLIAAYRPDPAR